MVAKCLESLFEVDLNYFSHLIKKIAVEMVPNSSKFAHIYIMFCLTETSAKFNQNLSNPIFFSLSPSLSLACFHSIFAEFEAHTPAQAY